MRNIRLPALQNVAPNSRASLRLPLGVTYEKLYFILGTNIIQSIITNVVLRINNKEFFRWNTWADYQAYLNYKGNGFNAGFTMIDFTERKARDEVAVKLGTIAACAEAGVQDMTLEFDLGAYAQVAASTITAFADVEAPSANSIIQRVQVMQKTIAAAAQEQIFIPFGLNGYQVKRLVIKHVNLSSVKIRRDGVDFYEDLPIALANAREVDFGNVPQAGYHVVDFMPDYLQSNAFNTAQVNVGGKPMPVQNLDIRVTTSAADTLTIYTEAYALNSQL
ncbi:MAG: major capsid protein P2 [Burkholderiaceae bacterium]